LPKTTNFHKNSEKFYKNAVILAQILRILDHVENKFRFSSDTLSDLTISIYV